MAQLPKPFNASMVDPSPLVGQLPVSGPEGLPVIIIASEFKPVSSNPANFYAELTLSVIDGSHKGETGPFRLNLVNDNQTAMRIAESQLSAICHATGQMNISDTSQLHNLPFRVIVVAKTFKNQQGQDVDGSEIKGILDINGNKPGKPQAAPSAPQQGFAPPAPIQQAQAQPAWSSPAQVTPGPVVGAPGPVAGAPPWAR